MKLLRNLFYYGVLLLDQMVPGQKPKSPVPPKRDTGYRPIGLAERPLDWLVF